MRYAILGLLMAACIPMKNEKADLSNVVEGSDDSVDESQLAEEPAEIVKCDPEDNSMGFYWVIKTYSAHATLEKFDRESGDLEETLNGLSGATFDGIRVFVDTNRQEVLSYKTDLHKGLYLQSNTQLNCENVQTVDPGILSRDFPNNYDLKCTPIHGGTLEFTLHHRVGQEKSATIVLNGEIKSFSSVTGTGSHGPNGKLIWFLVNNPDNPPEITENMTPEEIREIEAQMSPKFVLNTDSDASVGFLDYREQNYSDFVRCEKNFL